jgi:hypothetical protein
VSVLIISLLVVLPVSLLVTARRLGRDAGQLVDHRLSVFLGRVRSSGVVEGGSVTADDLANR